MLETCHSIETFGPNTFLRYGKEHLDNILLLIQQYYASNTVDSVGGKKLLDFKEQNTECLISNYPRDKTTD